MATIPGDVDLLVAGFSCVDFSQLNSHKLDLNDPGESGDTFRAILNYAKKWRPRIIVLENVSSAPWDLIKGYWQSHANYSAEWLRVDTKAYYIPHTRIRGYMICIDNEKLGSSKEIVGKWKRFLEAMKRPASCPIEAFLLPEDDPRVHRGREELSKGLRGGDKNAREVDWTRCQGRHQDYRADLLLGSKRPMTGWEDNGSCKMPDYCWNDWGTTQVERIWDTFEVSLLRNARRGFDSQYKTFVPLSALTFDSYPC
jgi:site-specific DNA-cytosine methylase